MSASTHSQVDLGCGSGLSTRSALNAANGLGVIGLDLSSEMLRAEEWKEVRQLGLKGSVFAIEATGG